jgi:hypothetical protein
MNYSKKTASLVTINKIGGNMGPRIKLPKECNRILEQKQLKAFILNPSSLGTGKMPKPANLNSKDIDRLLFRIHGKSQAITRIRIQFTFRHNNSFSTETLL